MNIDEFKISIESHVKVRIEELSKGNDSFDDTIKGYELKVNKDSETILLCNCAVIKIIQSKNKEIGLKLSKKYLDLFELQNEAKFTKSETNWGRLPFNESAPVQIINNIKAVFDRCYLNPSVESFGCCSRYEECREETGSNLYYWRAQRRAAHSSG
jgi:hypothetical protein